MLYLHADSVEALCDKMRFATGGHLLSASLIAECHDVEQRRSQRFSELHEYPQACSKWEGLVSKILHWPAFETSHGVFLCQASAEFQKTLALRVSRMRCISHLYGLVERGIGDCACVERLHVERTARGRKIDVFV